MTKEISSFISDSFKWIHLAVVQSQIMNLHDKHKMSSRNCDSQDMNSFRFSVCLLGVTLISAIEYMQVLELECVCVWLRGFGEIGLPPNIKLLVSLKKFNRISSHRILVCI